MADIPPLTVEEFAQSLPDAVIFFDASGAVTFANTEARKRFGTLPEGLALRMKFRAPEMRELLDAVIANGAQRSIDYSEAALFERWYKATAMAVGAARGQFVLVLRDQSEARQLERMRADFVANASHELRTPLASINGFIETLSGPAKNDEKAREKFLGIMQQQTARMSRLIDDLLSLSRLETTSTARQDPVDIRNVLAHVVNALSPLAAENGVTIENRIADRPIVVSGDRDELIQVFQNLIENACKYGRSGGKIVLSTQSSGAPPPGECIVTVTDFGPGIAPQHIPRITERFYRVESGSKDRGTGLGLAIVKHILARHGGRLAIRSELGKGSEFSVHLPSRAK